MISVLFSGSYIIEGEKKAVSIEKDREEKYGHVLGSEAKEVAVAEDLDPWMMYLYAMKSPATKEKYMMRLGRFLDFIDQQETNKNSSLEEKARLFANKGRTDNGWAFTNIIRFLQFQKERHVLRTSALASKNIPRPAFEVNQTSFSFSMDLLQLSKCNTIEHQNI